MVNTELRGCGNMTDDVDTDAAEKTGPGKFKEEAGAEMLVGSAGAERASRKSEGVENAGTVGRVVSKRPRSRLESCKVIVIKSTVMTNETAFEIT